MQASTLIPELEEYGRARAAGILSRAALQVESDGMNPEVSVHADEQAIRDRIIEKVVAHVRQSKPGAASDEIKQRVLEFLDEETSKFESPVNEQSAIERLSADASLPSDVYAIELDESLKRMIKDLGFDDTSLAIQTIRTPEFEQHFGSAVEEGPKANSLFARWFAPEAKDDRFLLLVICFRKGDILKVNQFWRIYPKNIPVVSGDKLTDIIKRFSDAYGTPFKIGRWQGKYLYNARIPVTEDDFEDSLKIGGREGQSIAGTGTVSRDGDFWNVSFAVSINVDKYKRDVSRHLRHEKMRSQRNFAPPGAPD